MKVLSTVLMLTFLCGCRTPTLGPDLLQLYQQRLEQLGTVNVPEPTAVPFDAMGERQAYLDGYRNGYQSGLTGFEFAKMFPADIPERNAHIKGWCEGQRAGFEKSPWTCESPLGMRVSNEPTNSPIFSPASQ